MRIAVATDHAGFPLKQTVLGTVLSSGQIPIDLGTDSLEPVDIPDFTEKAGLAISGGGADRAIVICGSGVGACIAGNKIPGVYASAGHDPYSAAQGVEHGHMNMLCLGARVIGQELAKRVVLSFLQTEPADVPRYLRRVGKIKAIEAKHLKGNR